MRALAAISKRKVHFEQHVASSVSPEPPEPRDLADTERLSDYSEGVVQIPLPVVNDPHDNAPTIQVKRESCDTANLFEDVSSLRPRKRRRLIVEVVVPTWAEVKKKKEAYEDDLEKLKKMKNPKAKKIKNMELLPDTVRSRLKHLDLELYPITLDKATQEVMVTRRFMSSTYGGSMQAVQPSIAKKFLDIHGLDDFFYMNLDYQPEAPQVPGAHGLYFCTEAGKDIAGIQRVFTRIQVSLWQYQGMYTATSTISLTKEEWAIQPVNVRNTWARQICLQEWGGSVMARVRFRKEMGREPTEQETIEFFQSKRYKTTTPEEVAEAYDNGEERLGVWIMECVGYDNEFQLQLCEKLSTYVPPPKKAKKGKQDGKKSTATSSQRGHKDKRSKSLESEAPEPESEHSEKDEEYGRHLIYKHRGTRSRPIHLL